MRTNKKPFYNEFMTKKSPKVPQCICAKGVRRWLRIISPSLYLVVAMGLKGEKARIELEEFERCRLRYMCHKRTLTKSQWKSLHRKLRKESKEHEK